jgi:hypothetical protein
MEIIYFILKSIYGENFDEKKAILRYYYPAFY